MKFNFWGLGFSCDSDDPKEIAKQGSVALCIFAAGYMIKRGIDCLFSDKLKQKTRLEATDAEVVEDKDDAPRATKCTPVAETLNQTLSKDIDLEHIWLVDSMIPFGGRVLLMAPSGQGKTTLGQQLCIEAAEGKKSAILSDTDDGIAPEPVFVIGYDAESDDADIHLRFSRDYNYPDNYVRVTACFNSISAFLEDVEMRIKGVVRNILICIDNLSTVFKCSTDSEIQSLFNGMKSLQEKFMRENGVSVTFIAVVHTTKAKEGECNEVYRGSGKLGDVTSDRFALFPTRFGSDYKMLKQFKCRKNTESDEVTILKRVEKPYLHFEYHSHMPMEKAEPLKSGETFDIDDTIALEAAEYSNPNQKLSQEDIQEMREYRESGESRKEVAEAFGVSEKTVSHYCKTQKKGRRKKDEVEG